MRISVITPVYNRADCILRCLESVAAENIGGARVEHVIADDGSTDESAEIVADFAACHPGVQLVRLPRNAGPNAARNAAIAAATGDFVLFIDSDDSLAPGAISVIEKNMSENPGYDQYLFSCSHNRTSLETYGRRHVFDYSDFLLGDVRLDFAHVINRATLLEMPFDESLRIHEYLFHLRFYRKAGKILFIDELVSIVDTSRSDHVTYTTRKTNDRALAESLVYTRLFLEWFAADLSQSAEGCRLLESLKTDFRRFSILSGRYDDSRRAGHAGYRVSSPYLALEYTRTGHLAWQAVKLAMRVKWFLIDKLKK